MYTETIWSRNHRFALQQSHIQYDMRKFSFPNRIIPLWNSLPDYVVSSSTLNTFKARLDRFWEDQEVRYNWKADILYTGSRRNVELMVWLLYSDCTIFGVIYNGLDIEVHDLRPAIYTTTTTTTLLHTSNYTRFCTNSDTQKHIDNDIHRGAARRIKADIAVIMVCEIEIFIEMSISVRNMFRTLT